ncbi:hypothetical protein B0H67DRAFT_349158 [Lasiosphaeris hirsuta]|uniref:DUF7600 domain-containing protein n=1 Tax=Lasiosphaeris hirsuta TaxID=260670 RepID=A0AA39ZVM8_9PEZI|nr:hypothetical protein B0H67DRAFT_349158 [Lasiosphaeris hirsuta]
MDMGTFYACAICRQLIGDYFNAESPNGTWQSLYRGICEGVDNAVLTGVGWNEYDPGINGIFRPPTKPDVFYWDDGYDIDTDSTEFHAKWNNPANTIRGYAVHFGCWRMLELMFAPAPVPHTTFFNVCSSLPFAGQNIVLWGHEYYGLGEDPNKMFQIASLPFYKRSKCNPIGFAPDVFEEFAREPPVGEPAGALSTRVTANGKDCFFQLPTETRLAICIYLPTTDALYLRLASKAFWFFFDDQQFWRSRFRYIGFDRGWLLYNTLKINASRKEASKINWRWLYHRTTETRMPHDMLNQKRVWDLAAFVYDILSLRWSGQPVNHRQQIPGYPVSLRDETSETWTYREVSSLSECPFGVHAQVVDVPASLSRISFSFVLLGDGSYLAGMKFTASDESVVEMGYQQEPGKQLHVDITSELRGFSLEVAPRGIRNVRCVTKEDSQSPPSDGGWVRDPIDDLGGIVRLVPYGSLQTHLRNGALRLHALTDRLVVDHAITSLKADFDVGAPPPPCNSPPRC